jgi:hypothetical protein
MLVTVQRLAVLLIPFAALVGDGKRLFQSPVHRAFRAAV